jgi:hypothetical protein
MPKHTVRKQAAKVSKAKARKILRHGKVHGKKLTGKQRRMFGARAGGK